MEPMLKVLEDNPTDIANSYLDGLSIKKMAVAWTYLNKGEWPTQILGPYKESVDKTSLLFIIMEKIGLKECLREWNSRRFSKAEFEAWWSSIS